MATGCKTGKVRYRNEYEAAKQLKRILYKDRQKYPCRVYCCPLCKGYHLTSKEIKQKGRVINNDAFKRFLES